MSENISKKLKRPYRQKVRKSLIKHRQFLTEYLESEWDRIEKQPGASASAQTPEHTMTKIVFALIRSEGQMTVGPSATNLEVLTALGRIGSRRIFFGHKNFKDAASYLRRKKFVTVLRREGGWNLRITDRGIERLLALAYHSLRIKKISPWDKTWRLVIFDIPNDNRWARDCFRRKLKSMRFHRLQKSVFVSPYPCEQEVKFLGRLFDVSRCIRIVETKALENDFEVRKFFNLVSLV